MFECDPKAPRTELAQSKTGSHGDPQLVKLMRSKPRIRADEIEIKVYLFHDAGLHNLYDVCAVDFMKIKHRTLSAAYAKSSPLLAPPAPCPRRVVNRGVRCHSSIFCAARIVR
jgi:hypothetical protein